MKVIHFEEGAIEFDNGLKVYSEHSQDCCEYNYLDFEQLPVGTELPDMKKGQFVDSIELKEDGFSVKDIHGVPKWVQARSNQNGYYSNGVDLVVEDDSGRIVPKGKGDNDYYELFRGEESY